jgi:transposase InsO family protein
MYILTDTFNRTLISRHRSARAAVRAQRKHLSDIRRRNGENSFLTYSIRHSSGRDIQDEVMDAKFRLDMER